MKTVWIASIAIAASSTAFAQSTSPGNTIYKHVDESGRITYTNRPMKGAVPVDLEPISTIPGLPPAAVTRAAIISTPTGSPVPDRPAVEPARLEVVKPSNAPAAPQIRIEPLPDSRAATAVGSAPPQAATAKPTLAAVEPSLQRKRDEERRRILADELRQEEDSLEKARVSLSREQQNPQLVAAVRAAQAAADPTPAQMVEFRNNIEKASGRIRGLQATVAEHEKNIEALKKELGALKP